MFTGIIQDIGVVSRLRRSGTNIDFSMLSKKLIGDVKVGDSVAISGVCLTVTDVDRASQVFWVTAVSETLKRTTLVELQEQDCVNLELALLPTDRLGGHFMQGHVDTIGRCVNLQRGRGSWILRFEYPDDYSDLIVEKGSMAIDGVSLTAIEVSKSEFSVSVIPHTLESTNMQFLRPGRTVNLEFDLIGKYVQNIITKRTTERLTQEKLERYGY